MIKGQVLIEHGNADAFTPPRARRANQLGVVLLAIAHLRNVTLVWQTHAAPRSYPVQEASLTMAGVELEDES